MCPLWVSYQKIRSVKGSQTNKYYPKGHLRTHMDFDYLASKVDDAFFLISYLLNQRGFKLVMNGSVPFSFKNILDEKNNEILLGHIHLEKILQNKYQVVVDINMGGFPLGRTGVIKLLDSSKIEIEDLICITLAHLFKHEHVFIKDINDLYYLLKSKEVNKDILKEKLDKYNLNNLFFVSYNFLRKKMDLKEEYNILKRNFLMNLFLKKWPYSRKSNFYIKTLDMYLLNKKNFGILRGLVETKKQIFDNSGIIPSQKYREFCENLNERVYLYPIVIFKKYITNFYKDEFIKVENNIMLYENIVILPIGLFLIQKDKFNREKVEKRINKILLDLKISLEECNFLYTMEARKDTWLY